MNFEELININQYDYKYKGLFLEDIDSVVDKGIRELVDAINGIDVFMTMNSCQGSLIESEKHKHCPLTYVDFYVLYHQYHIAHNLFTKLINKFGSILNCQVSYEADFDIDEEDYAEDNGTINMRFRLELVEADNIIDVDKIYKELVEFIKDYKKSLKG